MTLSDILTITQLSKADNHYHFDCIGSVDAHAEQALKKFSDIPENAHVLLDFKKIERVNSMGLSLLLKVFEEWENKNIKIEIKNLNRMINMLFKITGLGRFLKGGGEKGISTPNRTKIIRPKSRRGSENTPTSTKLAKNAKLNFVASLQSGSQLSGWYLFNTYMQRQLQRAIHFEQEQDKKSGLTDLFFAKPFEACSMIYKKGFIPIMRPIAEADEVIILVREGDSRQMADFKNIDVVTASEDSFVYLLGRFLCDESHCDSSSFNFHFAGNEIKALQMLIRKKADVLFMLKKTYDGLSSFGKKNVRAIDESKTDFAFHQFCVAPHMEKEVEALSTMLASMKDDKQGQGILNDIQFEGWCKSDEGELKMLKMVFERYTLG
jgi:anti-anti-sigma factor